MSNTKVIFSNKIENLLDRFSQAIVESTGSDHFLEPECVLIDNKVMGQWLNLQLALKNGIAANQQYMQPSELFWTLARKLLDRDIPRQSPFSKDKMTWRILAILSDEDFLENNNAHFNQVLSYLNSSGTDNKPEKNSIDIKRFQLASSIADLFDQYLIYRPDWINRWSSGESVAWEKEGVSIAIDDMQTMEKWQKNLWKRLLDISDDASLHRAQVYKSVMEKLVTGENIASQLNMNSLFVFGISTLPPSVLQCLLALGKHIPVNLYVLNPSDQFWFDIKSGREWVKNQLKYKNNKDEELYSTVIGNPLLAANGQQVKEFIENIVSLEGEEFQIDDECYEFPERDTLLHDIQSDIFEMVYCGSAATFGSAQYNKDSSELLDEKTPLPISEIANKDSNILPSIRFHSCYSRMREVEVLHDQLLYLFTHNKSLMPRDVVIMMPDVSPYAAYIETVFGSAREKLPYHITDRSRVDESPLLLSIELILNLPESRIPLSEVLAILEVPCVQVSFGIDADGYKTLVGWLKESGARWGLDAEHRENVNVTAFGEYSWQFAIDRLWTGYSMSSDTETHDKRIVNIHKMDVMPYDEIEGNVQLYEGFVRFWNALLKYRKILAEGRNAIEWSKVLTSILDEFYKAVTINDEHAVTEVDKRMMAELRENILDLEQIQNLYDGEIKPEIIRAWLKPVLNSPGTGMKHWREGIKFCSLLPMRAVPFKVVYLMGMNMSDYPKRVVKQSFDLMSFSYKSGDRSRRVDDRWLFFEALLSAREHFYISYIGRNIRTNKPSEPSVVVDEFFDYLRHGYRVPENIASSDIPTNVVSLLTTMHPLQPFSQRYVDGSDDNLFTYTNRLGNFSEIGAMDGELSMGWPKNKKTGHAVETSLDDFILFFKDPVKWLFNKQFKIYLRIDDNVINDQEELAWNDAGLVEWNIRNTLLERLKQDGDIQQEELDLAIENYAKEMKASGTWPLGIVSEKVLESLKEKISSKWINAWQFETNGLAPCTNYKTMELSTSNGKLTISGDVSNINGKLLYHSSSKKKPKYELDFYLLCCFAAATDENIHSATSIFFSEASFEKESFDIKQKDHTNCLAILAELYMQYSENGLPFEINLAEKLVDVLNNPKKSEEDAVHFFRQAIKKYWLGDYNSDSAEKDIQLRAYYLSLDRLLSDDFYQVCRMVWQAINQWKKGTAEGEK